jgi:hypothetical protein
LNDDLTDAADEPEEMEYRPNLQTAKRRVKRATDHINEAVEVIRAWAADLEGAEPLRMMVDKEQFEQSAVGEELDLMADWSGMRYPDTTALSIYAGECIYNLRAALDYLVFNLAWLDSGQEQRHTQFPIVDKESNWKEQLRFRLPGVTDEHATLIREVQPFEGIEWTRRLRESSNVDKHRLLVSVTPQWSSEFSFDEATTRPHPADSSKLILGGDVTVELGFIDGSRFPETLKTMTLEVATFLQQFNEAFGERDTFSYREVPPPALPGDA